MFLADREIDPYIEKISGLMGSFTRSIAAFEPTGLLHTQITMPQFAVLQTIKKSLDCKMTDIAKAFGIKLASVTGMVDRLEAEGYVVRERDKNDRRVVRVRLTKVGELISNKISKAKQSNLIQVLKLLTKNERDCFVKIMEKMAASFQNRGGVK